MDTTHQLKIVEQDYLFPNAESLEIAKKEYEKFSQTIHTIRENAVFFPMAEKLAKMDKNELECLSNLVKLEISCRKTNGSFL